MHSFSWITCPNLIQRPISNSPYDCQHCSYCPTYCPTASPSKNPTKSPSVSPSTSRTVCYPRASKVKLQSLTSRKIQVFEVEVFSSGNNVAVGKTATQSTTYKGKANFAANSAIQPHFLTLLKEIKLPSRKWIWEECYPLSP